ncbi:hypothetical protein ACWEO4_39815 [Streptomyces sp. NPDC004393]
MVPNPVAEVENAVPSEQDAEDTARRLLRHDRAHGTGRGPVPAADARWDQDVRHARQEHAAAVRDERRSGAGPTDLHMSPEVRALLGPEGASPAPPRCP